MVQSCSRSKQLHNCIIFYTTLLGDNAHLKGQLRRPDSRFAMHAPWSCVFNNFLQLTDLSFNTRALCKAGERSSSYSLFSLVPSAQLWNVAWRDVSRTEWFILYGFPVELERDFRHQNDKIVRPGASRLSPICSPNERGRATASEIGKLLDLVEVVYTRREVVLVLGLG